MSEKVLFWDFDGTLSHPNRCFSSALHMAAAEVGYTLDATASAFLGNAYSWKSPFTDHTAEVGEAWWQALYARLDSYCRDVGIPEDALSPIHACFRRILTRVDNYCLYEDAVSTLESCHRMGYDQYLLTNNYPEIVDVVKALGLATYFSDCIVSSHVGYDKPRAELYRYAVSLAGDPSVCYMIGDNPVADIAGGRAAGLTTIYVHNGFLPKADFSVERLMEIPGILK